MCGIAGFVQRDSAIDLQEPLRRMQEAVSHRGPDDRGTWRSRTGQASYAHTRLSILDPSPAGHQPMTVADGRFAITYNGEIYNFAELRETLRRSGVTFQSNTDTEVLLRLYEAEGPGFVQRLRGMFAFAIWDERERTCLLARDRFGIKPLYYHEGRGVLTFASEVRALLASGVVAAAIDPQALYEYFRTGSVTEPRTLIDGVSALGAGQYLLWRDGAMTATAYWQLTFSADAAGAPSDPVAATRAALADSIAHHFVSDVPVGVFLSGGVDSTAIVALSRQVRGGELRTFSLSFPGSPLDEGAAARRTAAHFGTTHQEWAIDAATARTVFDTFLDAGDQPSIDGFNTYTACLLARRYDTKVVLSGLGGDELFGGYPSFRNVPRLARLGQLASRARPLANGVVTAGAKIFASKVDRLHDLVAGPPGLGTAYEVFRGVFTRAESLALTRHYAGASTPINQLPSMSDVVDPTDEDTVSRLELTRYMRNQLLRDADMMSMTSGVELRVPFLDAQVVDTVTRIPARVRLERGKSLLRNSVPELPEWVVRQPKRAFLLPVDRWIEGAWSDVFAQRAQPHGVAIDSWYRKWSVLAAERWMKRTGVAHG